MLLLDGDPWLPRRRRKSEMNSFSQKTTGPRNPHFRRARRHRNSRRHLRRPLLTRFTNDFDLLQAILARQIVPANNCNADQGCQIDRKEL